ncbi:MAG: fluoride efflux transporter CrcB [Bradymonadaceae bacterium]|nr:fluoride efflux transporter CrcB [Lujinxingiaceae bacterium]
MILELVLLAIGGALGAVARFHLTRKIAARYPTPRFPLATLLINAAGSAALGLIMGLRFSQVFWDLHHDPVFLMLGVGFCGAFTTFSTFNIETMALLRDGGPWRALGYIAATLIACVALFALCFWAST